MSQGLIQGTCGGLLRGCCHRTAKSTNMGNDASHPVDLTDLPKLDFGPVVNEASECCQLKQDIQINQKNPKTTNRLLCLCGCVCMCWVLDASAKRKKKKRINQNCCVVTRKSRFSFSFSGDLSSTTLH
jgi:hypothetical protein